MAFACLGLTEIPDDLLCQPAFLRKEKKTRFAANGLISNGYQSLAKARRILANDLDAEFMDKLFNEDRIIEVETNPSMFFTSSYLAGKYLLYGLQYYSTQRNQANPELEIFASESRQWIVQGSVDYQRWLFFGLQFRNQQDKIVRKRFRLVDLGTDSGKDLLKPQEYSRLFLEPGVGVVLGDFKFSVLGSGLIVSGDTEGDFPDRPEAQAGAAYEFSLPVGSLELALDYKSLSYEEESTSDKFHTGARFKYGALNLLTGVDSFGFSGGMLFTVEKIYSGILYSTSRVPWRDSEEYAQTAYIELGWQL
ncbi:MAG: hypothetical protein ACAH59_01145 [Pseudobdellovibrionaceae bacterium]